MWKELLAASGNMVDFWYSKIKLEHRDYGKRAWKGGLMLDCERPFPAQEG